MATRYSGRATIRVLYMDGNSPHEKNGKFVPYRAPYYHCTVSVSGKHEWTGDINPAPAGFGPGIGYDSPEAYDEIARSVTSFASHEKPDLGDEFDYDDQGGVVRRQKAYR